MYEIVYFLSQSICHGHRMMLTEFVLISDPFFPFNFGFFHSIHPQNLLFIICLREYIVVLDGIFQLFSIIQFYALDASTTTQWPKQGMNRTFIFHYMTCFFAYFASATLLTRSGYCFCFCSSTNMRLNCTCQRWVNDKRVPSTRIIKQRDRNTKKISTIFPLISNFMFNYVEQSRNKWNRFDF